MIGKHYYCTETETWLSCSSYALIQKIIFNQNNKRYLLGKREINT